MAYFTTVPLPNFMPCDYSTSTSTSPSPDYDYYRPQQHQQQQQQQPQYRTPVASPQPRGTSKRGHVRTTSYSTPRTSQWQPSGGYPSTGYHGVPQYYSSPTPAKFDYVSTNSHTTPRAKRFSASGNGGGIGGNTFEGNAKRRTSVRSQTHRIYVDVDEDAYDRANDSSEPVFTYIEPRSTHTRSTSTKKHATKADSYFFFNQTTSHEVDTPTRSRARRSSTTTRPKTSPNKPTKVPTVATATDAAEHQIPAGYSLKNWDPTEEPILLLGSVFDANSLGKWIYDWTVYHHKAGSPMTEVAGELWLLLIKFAGKVKRAEECLPRVRGRDNRDMIREFVASGDRIWSKLKLLIKSCEEFMWRAAKKEGARGKIQMGEKSGIEFVKSIFGRERELERTEKLMTSVRLWNMRFDVNCEDILRRPSAI